MQGKTFRARFVLLAAAVAALPAQFTPAATWVASTATVGADGNFSNGSNWDTGVAPGAVDTTNSTESAVFNSTDVTAVTVDANRNIQNITFGGAAHTLSGGPLLLTSGGTILANGNAVNQTLNAPVQIQGGGGGAYTFQTDTPGTNRTFTVGGGISGVATGTNVTALTLQGTSLGANTINGVISDGTAGGKLSVTKAGAGRWTIGTATNAYTGGTTIQEGLLWINNSGNLSGSVGTGTLNLTGGTLRLGSTGSATLNVPLNVTGTTSNIAVRGGLNFNPTAFTGTGTLNFTSAAGGQVVTGGNFLDFGGTLAVQGGVTLRLASAYTANSLRNAVVDLGATSFVTKQNGTNGTVTFDIGTLSGAAGANIGGSGAGGGTFVYSVGGRNENSTYAGIFGDGGTKTGLTKVGTATLTLTGASTHTGNTAVNAGTLVVGAGGTGSLGLTPVTVNATGTLGGSGTIGGTVSSVGGNIAPGNSVGTLTVNNVVALDAASTLAFELNGSDTTAGGAVNDLLTGLTGLTLDGTLNVTESVAGSFASITEGATYRLINYTGTLTDNGLAVGLAPVLPAGLSYAVDTATPGQVNLQVVSAIPEPTSLALFGVAGATAFARRRR